MRLVLNALLLSIAASCALEQEDSAGQGSSTVAPEGGCGGEAAHGGYLKAGGEWDGSAGNSYGYPASERPEEDCHGFGFHDSCSFWESCSYSCTSSADCPTENIGTAVPECREKADVGTPGILFTEQSLCVLPCATDADCPDGMECISHPYGFGVICMWEW